MTATETENSISAGNWRHRAEAIASIMVVASLPCLVVGPVTFAVFGGIGILLAAFLNGWEANVEALRKFLRSPIGIAIIFTFAAWAPGTIMSLDVGESISVVIRMILFTVVGILLYDFLNNRPQLLRLQLKTIIIGLFFAYFLSTITMVFFPEVIAQIKGYDLMEKHYGKLFFKRYASASVLFAPLLVWGGLALGNRWRIMAFGIVLLLPGYFVLLESRSAIAGLLAAFLIFVLLIGFRYRNKMILIGLWSVVGLGIAGALSYLAARYTSPPVPFDPILPPWLIDPHRQIIWMNTINLAEVKPWFGWGINTANFAINHNTRLYRDTLITGLSRCLPRLAYLAFYH